MPRSPAKSVAEDSVTSRHNDHREAGLPSKRDRHTEHQSMVTTHDDHNRPGRSTLVVCRHLPASSHSIALNGRKPPGLRVSIRRLAVHGSQPYGLLASADRDLSAHGLPDRASPAERVARSTAG